MTNILDTPYSVYLLVELYNLYGDDWTSQIKNEVRHELRQFGYIIQTVSDNINHTQALLEEKKQ